MTKAILAEDVYRAFAHYFNDGDFDVELIGTDFYPLPYFTQETINLLCKKVTEILCREPTLLILEGYYTIVGDLHGSILDLIRIFQKYGTPAQTRYIFLGNYVDRGEFSTEVLSLLFAAKICYPTNVYLLRGSHEFNDINELYGFREEVLSRYSNSLYEIINFVFYYLPLAALVNRQTFVVHSGISKELNDINDLNKIKRPNGDFIDQFHFIVSDLMWSIPSSAVDYFQQDASSTGTKLYGEKAVEDFFRANNLIRIIRGHQCVPNGFDRPLNNHKVITVFSASNYREGGSNLSGVICVKPDNQVDCLNDKAIPKLFRASAVLRLNGKHNEPSFRKHPNESKRRMRRFSSSLLPPIPKLEERDSCFVSKLGYRHSLGSLPSPFPMKSMKDIKTTFLDFPM